MNLPQELEAVEGTKNYEVRRKINDLIAFLESKYPRIKEEVKYAEWSNRSGEPQILDWRPVKDGSKYWMPPTGYRNKDGVNISGLVPIAEVPSDVLTAFKASETAQEPLEEA